MYNDYMEEYRKTHKEMKSSFMDKLPNEITIFGFKLKRNEYLSVAGLIILILILIGVYINKKMIAKQVGSYIDAMAEIATQT